MSDEQVHNLEEDATFDDWDPEYIPATDYPDDNDPTTRGFWERIWETAHMDHTLGIRKNTLNSAIAKDPFQGGFEETINEGLRSGHIIPTEYGVFLARPADRPAVFLDETEPFTHQTPWRILWEKSRISTDRLLHRGAIRGLINCDSFPLNTDTDHIDEKCNAAISVAVSHNSLKPADEPDFYQLGAPDPDPKWKSVLEQRRTPLETPLHPTVVEVFFQDVYDDRAPADIETFISHEEARGVIETDDGRVTVVDPDNSDQITPFDEYYDERNYSPFGADALSSQKDYQSHSEQTEDDTAGDVYVPSADDIVDQSNNETSETATEPDEADTAGDVYVPSADDIVDQSNNETSETATEPDEADTDISSERKNRNGRSETVTDGPKPDDQHHETGSNDIDKERTSPVESAGDISGSNQAQGSHAAQNASTVAESKAHTDSSDSVSSPGDGDTDGQVESAPGDRRDQAQIAEQVQSDLEKSDTSEPTGATTHMEIFEEVERVLSDSDSEDNTADDQPHSQIYDLTLSQLIGMNPRERGRSPLDHTGGSENYFIIRNKYQGRWFKRGHTLDTLNFLAYKAGVRTRHSMTAKFSGEELLDTWIWANTEGPLSQTESDKIPHQACVAAGKRYGIATEDDVMTLQTSDGTSVQSLPAPLFKATVDRIESTHGIIPSSVPQVSGVNLPIESVTEDNIEKRFIEICLNVEPSQQYIDWYASKYEDSLKAECARNDPVCSLGKHVTEAYDVFAWAHGVETNVPQAIGQIRDKLMNQVNGMSSMSSIKGRARCADRRTVNYYTLLRPVGYEYRTYRYPMDG